MDVRTLSLITDDVKYLYCAAHNFQSFLQDSSISRRHYGRRLIDLMAIQAHVPPGIVLPVDLMAFFFNCAQREAIKHMAPGVTSQELDIYFPNPPELAENAQIILQRLEQSQLLRALGQQSRPGQRNRRYGRGGRGGGRFRDSSVGRDVQSAGTGVRGRQNTPRRSRSRSRS
jgi:hypothetical protein